MLSEKHLLNYAKSLVWGLKKAREESGGKFESGDKVLLVFDALAIELAEIIQKLLLEEGIEVILEMSKTPTMEVNFYSLSDEEALKSLPGWKVCQFESLSGLIKLIAPQSLTHLQQVNQNRISAFKKSRKMLNDIRKRKEAKGKLGWTLCVMPTPVLAEAAEMSLSEYENEIVKICHLDDEDPLIFWEELYQKSKKVVDYLENLDIDYLHIQTNSGTVDLKVSIGNFRHWISVSGHNIPSFETFTSPYWPGTTGKYYANTTSFIDGNEVQGVELLFDDGRVIKASAKVGNNYLQTQLDTDEGARQLGEVSFTSAADSLITKYMAHILYDENVGGENGNCHVAIGCSFPDAYKGPEKFDQIQEKEGFNDSGIHWDLINTEKKTITIYLKNGEKILFYTDGKPIIP